MMMGGDTYHVDHQAVGFARIEPCPTAHHLGEQRRALGWTCHNHTVHRGLIVAFREHSTVCDDSRFACAKAVQQRTSVLKKRCGADAFRGNACTAEEFGQYLSEMNSGRKEQRLAAKGMFLVRRQNMLR